MGSKENNRQLVVKSNYLVEASYRLTVTEQKIMYLIISKISKSDIDFKDYEFRVSDFIKLLSLKGQSAYTDLKSTIRSLRSRTFTVRYLDNGKNKELITGWIVNAEYDEGTLKFNIDPKLKPFLIQLQREFTAMNLSNLMQLKSGYSTRIYELLKQYLSIGERTFKVDELKQILAIEEGEYKLYSHFKSRVLSTAQKEINGKTDINVNFEEIKDKRKVIEIKFIIKSSIMPIDEVCATKEDNSINKQQKATTELVHAIRSIFKNMLECDISDKSANDILNCAIKHREHGNNPIDLIKEVAEYSMTQNITTNFIGWFKTTVKDYVKPTKVPNASTFSAFEQRKYDFNKLERQLLGWDSETDEVTGEEYLQGAIRVND